VSFEERSDVVTYMRAEGCMDVVCCNQGGGSNDGGPDQTPAQVDLVCGPSQPEEALAAQATQAQEVRVRAGWQPSTSAGSNPFYIDSGTSNVYTPYTTYTDGYTPKVTRNRSERA
jgi:hypothetical protein